MQRNKIASTVILVLSSTAFLYAFRGYVSETEPKSLMAGVGIFAFLAYAHVCFLLDKRMPFIGANIKEWGSEKYQLGRAFFAYINAFVPLVLAARFWFQG